jgi:plastocyanin
VKFSYCTLGLGALLAGGAPEARRPVPLATGRIEGAVQISAALSARRPRFRIYTDPGPGATPPAAARLDSAAELRNVVIYLEMDRARTLAAPGLSSSAETHKRATIAQSDERFAPHVVAVLQGATVDFPNEDDVYHNVFSLSSAKTFDLGRYPRGTSRSVTFQKPGTVQVFCHIHSDMSAVVLVLDNPFFATPETNGRFALNDVPPGDYTIVAWHERVKPISRHVHVTSAGTSSINFNIPVPPPEAVRP